MLGVRQADPADVDPLVVGAVHGAEAQPFLGGVEPVDPVGVRVGEGLPLHPGLRRAGARRHQHRAQLLTGLVAQVVQPVVQDVDIHLFAREFVLVRRRHL